MKKKESDKSKKYLQKIIAQAEMSLFDDASVTKLNELIEDHDYYGSIINSNNPRQIKTPYNEDIIVFQSGETTYKLRKYANSLIKHDDINHELMFDDLTNVYDGHDGKQINLTRDNLNDLLNCQIMLGYFYTDTECVKRLSLVPIDDLNIFTRTIVKMVLKKVSSI